jgi:hypothetical protein
MSDADPLLIFAVYALATARLTALATGVDELTADWTLKAVEKINPGKLSSGWRYKVAYGIACMWCASVWLALLLVAPVAYWFPTEPWAMIPATALAFSFVAGATSGWGRD